MSTFQTFIPGKKITADFVPDSYSEMFQHYYIYVVKLVTNLGITPQNAEDVAMVILTKFIEKDRLPDFDPEYVSEHGGVKRKATFRTFLSGFVATYVQHQRTIQMKQTYREGQSTNQPVAHSAGTNEGAEWIDLYGPKVTDDHDALAEADLLRQIRVQLAQIPSRNTQDRCNLSYFFEAVLAQTEDKGKADVAELALQFGVSKTTIQNWIKRLRTEVSVVIEVV